MQYIKRKSCCGSSFGLDWVDGWMDGCNTLSNVDRLDLHMLILKPKLCYWVVEEMKRQLWPVLWVCIFSPKRIYSNRTELRNNGTKEWTLGATLSHRQFVNSWNIQVIVIGEWR